MLQTSWKKLNQMPRHSWYLFGFVVVAISTALLLQPVEAQEVGEIRNKIADRNQKIEEIEQEIAQYEKELGVIGEEKQTLQGAIGSLDVSRRKIGADISLTANKIGATDLEIKRLALEIARQELQITKNQEALAKSLRNINEIENDSLVETLLANNNLNEVWERVETLERFQLAVRDDIKELAGLRDELSGKKYESEDKKGDLEGYRSQLSGQKRVLDENRAEKTELLSTTQNKEANYQRLLEEKRAAREKFEQELGDLESQLEYALDPSSIPAAGKGVLAWPLNNVRITQYFGNTSFAQSGAYSGRGHNGIDLAASSGSQIKAALGGVVSGTGNTDQVSGCYSYGKWILLKHNNGLSTLYAHLSVINVSPGQAVATREVIGFSGNTGYSTGPHLHFSTYLSDAVQIVRLGEVKAVTNCGPARIPIAPLNAYLNPLDYLDS